MKTCNLFDIRKLIKSFETKNKDIEACRYDPDIAAGACEPVTIQIAKLFTKYCDNVNVLRLSEAAFDVVDGAKDYSEVDSSDIGHTVLKVGEYVIDLTSSQFGKNYPQKKVIKFEELEKLWKEVDFVSASWGRK